MQELSINGSSGQGVRFISLCGRRGNGKVAMVSEQDYDALAGFKWRLVGQGGYAARTEKLNGQWVLRYMHREIMNFPAGLDVDHIDGDKLNNTRQNLRAATRSQNNYNQRKVRGGKSSKYRGVTWCANRARWVAQVWATGKNIVLGYFRDEEEAARTRDGAALALHGDFAVRSVPNLEPIPYKPPKPLVKTSSKPGVGWCKSHKRWRAFTTVAGKCKHLGYFRTEEEAYEAYTQFCAG